MFKPGDRVVAVVTIVCKGSRIEHGTAGRVVNVMSRDKVVVLFERMVQTDERDRLHPGSWVICHPDTVKPLHNPQG